MYSTSVTILNFTELPPLPSDYDNGSLDYGVDPGQKDQSNPVWGMPMFENNALANLSDAEYLAMVLGPKNVGLPLLIPITIIYVLIFISGVIGNVAVCLVIIKNKSMHTATNYYLFSLAISDLMILVLGLPNDLAIYWQQYPWMLGEAMCKGRSLVSEMTSYSSVLIIVSFSMERYLAICHPLYSHTMSGFKRAVRIICLVWLISLVSAIPYAIFTRLNYIDRPLNSGNFLEESAFCALLDDNIYPKNYPVHQLSSFLFFIFPMGILVILYIRMGFRIRQTSEIQRNLPRSSTQNHQNHHGGGGNNGTHPPGSSGSFTDRMDRHTAGSRRTVLRMLSAVVFAFFLCWAPFHAQRLSYVYFKESMIFRTINEYLYYVSGFLYYLSATVNPILYNLMSLKYRHAFRQTLCGKGTSSRRRRPGTINRSYTFRSTTRTVVENNGSDWDPRMRNEGFGSFRKRQQDGTTQRFSFHKSSCSDGKNLNSSTSDKISVPPGGGGLGRRARSYPDRSEFQHAMHLANAAFSDIVEEDSQVSNSGGGGIRFSQPSLVSPCCSVSVERADVKFALCQPGAHPLISLVPQGEKSLSRSRSASPKPATVDSFCQTAEEPNRFVVNCHCVIPAQQCCGSCDQVECHGDTGLPSEAGAVGQIILPNQPNAFEADVKEDDDQDSGNGSVSELHALLERESQARLHEVQYTKA